MTTEPNGGSSAYAPRRQRKFFPPRTGTLLFLTLGLALAPLGVLGVSSAVSQMQGLDQQRIALLRSAVREQSRNMADRLRADAALATSIASPVRTSDSVRQICDRLKAIEWQTDVAPQVTLIDVRDGSDRCQLVAPPRAIYAAQAADSLRIDDEARLLIHRVTSPAEGTAIILAYPAEALSLIAGPSQVRGRSTLVLQTSGMELSLLSEPRAPSWLNLDLKSSRPVGRFNASITGMVNRSVFDNFSSALGVATPFIMWLLAIGLSWLLVHRLLLTPVARMGSALSQYEPGQQLAMASNRRISVAEIDQLEGLAQGLVDRVNADKDHLSASLSAQQALTREVHHRVKNNLQIIASLVNLHSRDSHSEDAAQAYRVIARRVAALSVVYRHLQAQGESKLGVPACTLLADLVHSLNVSLQREDMMDIKAESAELMLDQDVALPVAFFVTELVELSTKRAPNSPIFIRLESQNPSPAEPCDAAARLSVMSVGLAGYDLFADDGCSYRRVVEGLSRQLRSPLDHDAMGGRVAVLIGCQSAGAELEDLLPE